MLLQKYFSPDEFARKLEVIEFINANWKAADYRQFGLYLSLSFLEGLVSSDCFWLLKHLKVFNMLLVGIGGRTPSNEDFKMAQKVIEVFVSLFIYLNAGKGVLYCVHLALHIVCYVRKLGCSYSRLSAFSYDLRDLRA